MKRHAATYGIGAVSVLGLAVAATFFGSRSIEVVSWCAGIASLAVAVGTLVTARNDATAATPPAIGDTGPSEVNLATTVGDRIGSATPPPTPDPLPDADLIGETRQVAHVQIVAKAWNPYLERRGVSEGLLRGLPARELSPALAPLDEFLDRALPEINVEIRTAYRSRAVPAGTVARCWTVMLVDSILHDGGVGLQRWLLRETDSILRNELPSVPPLREMWKWMFDNYLRSTADQPETRLMQSLITEAITGCGDNHKRLGANVGFLIDIARDDPPTLRRIREVLKDHDGALRERGSDPAMLKRVQHLLARLGAATGPAPFNPDVVVFPADAIWPYPLQAMRFPLTVGDVNSILRRSGGTDPAMPYVIPQDRADGTAFGGMWRELSNILGSLSRPMDRDDWRWDIPTVAEWITLAGCVDQPYPWGFDPPTQLHANLRFEPNSRLNPVGTYVAGRSPAGVYDCCGGVHEIVRELPHDKFDTDHHFENAFRLAGGSYLSLPQAVTGQKFRHLSPHDRGDRPSCVGIRLIAYRERDEALRWQTLHTLRVGRQTRVTAPTPVAATASDKVTQRNPPRQASRVPSGDAPAASLRPK